MTVNFVMPAFYGTPCLHWIVLRHTWYLSVFRNYVDKIQVLIKPDKDTLREHLGACMIVPR